MNTHSDLDEPVNEGPGLFRRENFRWRFEYAIVALALLGALLAVLPHLDGLLRSGDPEYLADGDQLLYMGWSRLAVLHGTPALGDAVHEQSGPMMHPWLLFVPPSMIANKLGIGLKGLTILWRCLGGAGVALGSYFALRAVLKDRRVALGIAAFVVFDAGYLFGQPIYRQLDVLQATIRSTGEYYETVPRIMAHLRIVPPSMAIPFLLVHLGAVAYARRQGGRLPAVAAGLSFALLFYIYFYFWTTAFAALALAFVVDPKGRAFYAKVAIIGLVVGLPVVIEGGRVKAAYPADWLHRTDKFVTIGRFDELLIPKGPILLWLLTTYWVFKRRNDLIYWWATIGAGFVCTNSQVVSRLQIENFHWLFAPGVTLTMLLAVMAASSIFEKRPSTTTATDEPEPVSKKGLKLLAVVVAAQCLIGFGLRWMEGTKSKETMAWRRVSESLARDAETVPEGTVLAGDREGVMLEAARRDVYPLSGKFLEYCANVKDDELDERILLNMHLNGADAEAARAEIRKPAGTLSWEAEAMRSEPLARAQQERRLRLIDKIWADPVPSIEKFKVTHILQRSSDPSPVKTLMSVNYHPKWLRTTGPWTLWLIQGGDGSVP